MYYYESYVLESELLFKRKTGIYKEHELHTHDVLEISVLQQNNARYRLHQKEYVGSPGDVFIFRPFEPHWLFVTEEEKPFQWVMVLFSPYVVRMIPNGYKWLTPFYADHQVSPLIPAASACAQSIQKSAELAVREKEAGKTGWEARQFMYFIDILIEIYRYVEQDLLARGSQMASPGILRTLEYILRNVTKEIDTGKLVQYSGLHKTMFYRQFKLLTGVSPARFVSLLRLQHASHLLRYSNDKVTEISLECGFVSLSNFNNQFKKRYGVSPREFRKNAGNAPLERS